MPWGAAAVIGGALIASDSGRSASNTQSDAANNASAEQRREYDQGRTDQAPWLSNGSASVNKLGDLLGISGNTGANDYGSLTKKFTGADVATDPGYQFGLTQGLKSLDSSAAARGGLYSGAQLKAAQQYGNDYATTKFDDANNRFNTNNSLVFNRLSGVAGTGQTAAGNLGALGANSANQIGQNMIGAGNARASGYLAQGNQAASAVNGLGYYGSKGGNLFGGGGNETGYGSVSGGYMAPDGAQYNNPSAYQAYG